MSISTNEYDRTKRKLINPGGEPFDYDETLTPYTAKIGDACDNPKVRVIGVKGNTRSSKTTKAESMLLRNWTYGPLRNVGWIMQDEDSLKRYIDERGEEMLRVHEEVNEKVDWNDKRAGRFFRQIGRSKLFYFPATLRSLRGFAAPILIADEIDAYNKRVRDAIMTLLSSRQEEFGSSSKAYICSHPDAGPDGGIDAILKDSLLHLWWVNCWCCGKAMSPAAEAEDLGGRMLWNVPGLMAQSHNMERVAFLNTVAQEARLVCPNHNCRETYDPDQRLKLMAGGQWLQPHQRLTIDGTVEGEEQVASIMGFVIHAFMAPFVKLRETARDWAAAKLTFDDTGNDVHLREVVVKKLGETFQGAKEDETVEPAKVVQARLASRYALKTVPPGVRFLTAFVDVQGDRFEVRVIGWDLGKQSWLIDAYAIKQWPRVGERGAFDNIDPGGKLSDWSILEDSVVAAAYPLAGNEARVAQGEPALFLPVARTMIDAVGVPGVTSNARAWLSEVMSRRPGGGKRLIEGYKIVLVHGASSKKAPLYGKPVPVEIDDAGKQRKIQVFGRYPNVHELKRIIARRLRIAEPGPGRMHLPANISARYARELTAEQIVNGSWVRRGPNETWDAWVMCEVARETLKPDRPGMWDDRDNWPEWADPRPRDAIDSEPTDAVNPFDRLAQINQGIPGEQKR